MCSFSFDRQCEGNFDLPAGGSYDGYSRHGGRAIGGERCIEKLAATKSPDGEFSFGFFICNMSRRVDTCVLFTYSVQLAMYFNSRWLYWLKKFYNCSPFFLNYSSELLLLNKRKVTIVDDDNDGEFFWNKEASTLNIHVDIVICIIKKNILIKNVRNLYVWSGTTLPSPFSLLFLTRFHLYNIAVKTKRRKNCLNFYC